MQPLGTKNHATSQDKKKHLLEKKNHTTSRDKKKSRNLLRQKNHSASRDGKKSRNLSEQTNHAPIGTKKNQAISLKFLSGHFEFVKVYLGLVN